MTLDERLEVVQGFVREMEIDVATASWRNQDHADGCAWVLRRARIRAEMPLKCLTCKGAGLVMVDVFRDGFAHTKTTCECPDCKGSGNPS